MRKTFVALLTTVMLLAACGGTKTCVASGFTPGVVYEYSYVDPDGVTQYGSLTVAGNGTLSVPNVDNGVNCNDIDLERALPVYIAN